MNLKLILVNYMVVAMTLFACGQKEKVKPVSPPGYDLATFEKVLLADNLLEVSGIAFAPGKFDSLYAHQDEDGVLFKVGLGSGKYRRIEFGGAGDYEDIAIMKDTVMLLQSDGSFYGFLLDSLQGDKATPFRFFEKILPKGEYEGLFADSLTHSYYALCKSCKEDKKQPQTSLYQLQIQQDSMIVVKNFTINTEKIIAEAGKKKTPFQPSALARHPITKDFYVISSTNKMLVVLDDQWQVKNIYELGRKNLMQPEGLAFDAAGNMYISSEGDDFQAGRILKFNYKQQQ